MENAISAATLSIESGSGTSWIVGGSGQSNLAEETIMHKELSEAPEIAKESATRLIKSLQNAILPASESDTVGRVVIIEYINKIEKIDSSNNIVTKEACFEALGLKKNDVDGISLIDEANVKERNFNSLKGRKGFCYYEDDSDEEEDEDNDDKKKVRMTTEIMAKELTHHFEFNFSERIVCAPVLYGGRASDGNIVAILSMRVWT